MAIENVTGVMVAQKTVRSKRIQREALVGLSFLSPWLIGFVLLKALPILAALIFSLTNFQMLNPGETEFIGLENYARFFGDIAAGANLFGSLQYFLLTVPLEMIVALLLAGIFTNARLKNKRLSRTLVFMTSIIPATSIFFIFLGSLQYAERILVDRMNLPPIDGFGLLLPFMALWGSGPAQGIHRYVLGAPAVFIALTRWGTNPVFDRAWTLLSILLMGMLSMLFAFNMWVA